MPARETFPGLDRAQFSLKPVRSQVMLGFVFVCLSGNPPPLEQIWGSFLHEFAPHRFEDMVPLGSFYIEHWDCDWKIAMDNYLESYHVPIGHPGLFRMFTPDYDDQINLPTGVARGISWMRERESSRWSERMYQRLIGQGQPGAAGSSTAGAGASTACCRTWASMCSPTRWIFSRCCRAVRANAPFAAARIALADDRREMRIARYLCARINRQVQREDEFLCRRVQLGLASGSYEPGPLSRLENCMLEFHELLRERIPEVRQASPPARFV